MPVYFPDWYKKDVVLHWMRGTWSFAVAQELFSSHEVDSGSLLLLRSLDMDTLPECGRCLDYGCGYGVLGLAIGAQRPVWEITLVDRDALAVAFSEHNAQVLGIPARGIPARGITALDPIDGSLDGRGYDLLLWNVPGKAGAPVLARLTGECLDVLAVQGTLALVVVHPLADVLRTAIAARDDVEIVHEQMGREHTVIHARRLDGQPTGSRDGFAAGVFDRDPVAVEYGEIVYRLTPVIGLPQYDGPDQATLMMMDLLTSIALPETEAPSVLIVRPGVGHLAMTVRARWPEGALTLVDRDLLALRSSLRAIGGSGEGIPAPDLDGVALGVDLAIAMLPDQMRPPIMARLLGDLVARIAPGGSLIVGGDSTEVGRFVSLAKKQPSLRLREQRKRRGVNVALLGRRLV